MTTNHGRLFAISDIHGCTPALDTLVAQIAWAPGDTLVALGDYVDRGPDSPQVIERLIQLQRQGLLIPLVGNHESMLLSALEDPGEREFWLHCGGDPTLQAYGGQMENIPQSHLEFLRSCQRYHESDHHFFVHANYTASLPLQQQSELTLLWEHLSLHFPGPHISGKQAIVGHTPQRHGEILCMDHLICIDTYCYGGGWLTLMDVEAGDYWQADRDGNLRGGGPRNLFAP
jgi:serine/threonine protein phosphatase 1